ncbi:MAG: excinuclease ABC subunit UvrC [Zoogloeaceae bacterium]|jgi:excinuclease ABC subunit C|nr:excinuclease ABC subunit UvrC [Zoogloeaceae bacterium]
MKLDKHFLSSLPELPGVYRMRAEDGAILYVGKAKNLKKRISSYFQKTIASPRIAMMVSQIAAIETTVTRSEAEALLLENNLIKRLAPRYNILFRDDKSYPYILLTRDAFPRLGFFRGHPDRKADYFGPFPSAQAVRESIDLLQKMFRLRTCSDSVFSHRSRPCLLHQIRRCSGPCVAGLVTEEDYTHDVRHAIWFLQGRQHEVLEHLGRAMETAAAELRFEAAALCRDQIQSLRQVQERQAVASQKSEDVDILVAVAENGQLCVNLAMVRGGHHLGDRPMFPLRSGGMLAFDLDEALAAFIAQHYTRHPAPAFLMLSPQPEDAEEILTALEVAAGRPVPLREARSVMHRAWVDMARQNALLAIAARSQSNARQAERLEALRVALQLAETPTRIECFDISHTRGELPVASCVAYQDQGMKHSDYRRFNIRDIEPGDDYAAMRQAVHRRYARLQEEAESGGQRLPDLILIDGGKGQTRVAAEALAELGLSALPVVGIVKGEGRKVGLESLVFPDERETLQLGAHHPALNLLVEIRDEAHRFAITGHRARRAKARNVSRLDEIPGIGAARRKALIARFGGLLGVIAASEEQLAQAPGISPALAKTIHAALH